MGTFSSPDKMPVQRQPAQQDLALGKSAQPPAFELKAEGDAQKPAQLQVDPTAPVAKPADPQAAPLQADAPVPAPAPEKSEADSLREKVAGKAEEGKGKEFMSQQEIDDTRIRTGLKNFTTCLEFAGKMMRDGDKEQYGKDWKKAAATTQIFSQTKADWELAVGAKLTADGWGKSVELFDKAITRVQKDLAKVEAEILKLRQAQGEGESEMLFKQRNIRADALEKHTVKAFNSVIRQLTGQREKFQGKADRSMEKSETLDANNTAMIKAKDGMTNGRPKSGEFIILSQAPGGTRYGIKEETKVFLAGGTFKHIAVFMEVLKEDDGSGFELWRTIDGGGTDGKETLLRIRLADRMIFPGQAGAKLPDAGSASGSQLAGWMDTEELLKRRDAKMAAAKK